MQEAEAKSLFDVLKTAAGDNQILEDNEIKEFAEERIGEEVDTNVFTAFVNNIFGAKEKPQTQAIQNVLANAAQKQQTFLEEAACKEIVIDIIDENLSEAYEILNSQYLGSISGLHDERKDKNDILKTSNVSKVLDYQKAGIEWMNKAKLAPPSGLTKKEYYEGNKQRIKDMILTRVLVLDTNTKFKELKNKYSEEELAQIIGDYVEKLCSNSSIDDLKKIQKQFVSYSGEEEVQVLGNIVDKAIKDNNKKNIKPTKDSLIQTYSMQTGIIPEYWDTDEPISFEEVYKIERGTEYSQYKIEQYALAKKEMEVVANAYNKKQQFIEFTEGLRKDETLNIDEKTQKVLEGFATFYALSEDGGLTQLKELIAESKLPISIDENGFNFGTLDDNAKNRALNSLLKLAQQSKEKEFEKFLKGKTIEDYQKALAQAQSDAIGDENGKMMAEAMRNDNLTCIQRWTGNTSMLGMGMTIVGGILCFTPLAPLGAGMITAGNTLAIGGMVAKTGLGAADYATKDVQTAEEAEQLTKDFIVDAGGFIIGMGAGKAGIKAFSKLIDKKLVAVFGQQFASGNKMQALKTVFTNPEYLKNFMTAAGAKLSADFVISYAGDLAMMGILDTQDDWQSLLKSNLTGILVGMSGDIKDVSGVGRPRNFGVSDGVKGVNEASRFDQPTSPHVKKPMTEMDYGQRLLGNDVTVADPKTGATVEGTVTGLYSQNGQVEIEVNGQRYSTNDVAEVKGEAKVSSDAEIKEVGEGDLSKVSEEFKRVLIDNLGMPEWAFDMKPFKIVTDINNAVNRLGEGEVVVQEFEGYGKIEITKYENNKFDYKLLDVEKTSLNQSINSPVVKAKADNPNGKAKRINEGATDVPKGVGGNAGVKSDTPEGGDYKLRETNTESRTIDAQTLETQKFKSKAEIEEFLNDYNQKCKNDGQFLGYSAIHNLTDIITEYPEMGGYVKLWSEDKNIKPRIFRRLIEYYSYSPQQTIEFLDMKKTDGSYRFSLNNIADSYLIENSIDYPEITDYFLNLKNPDGTFYLTNARDIDGLVFSGANNPDYQKIIEECQNSDGTLLKPDTYQTMISSGYSVEFIKNVNAKLNEDKMSAMLSLKGLEKLSDDELILVANDLIVQKNINNTSWKNDITERLNNNIYQKINSVIQENEPDAVFAGCKKDNFYKDAVTFTVIKNYNKTNDKIVFTIDNNGKVLRKEKQIPNKKPLPKIRTQTNTNSNIIDYTYSNFYGGSTKVVKDNAGNVLLKEYYRKSGVPHRYNIYRTENGKEYIVGLAEKTPAGNVIVEKTITSPDGTKNDYVYGQDADGSRFVYNKITDSTGKVLFENRRKLKVIDDDHIITSENGVNYDMQFDFFKGKMTVSILDDNNKVVDTVTHEFGNEMGQIAHELYPVMKQLPGELFFKMRDLGFNQMGIDKSEEWKNNAYYSDNNIAISPEIVKQDGAFTTLHEFGHFIDDKYNLCRSEELLKIFEEEKSKYLKLTSNKELTDMQYFIDELHRNDEGAITEVIAETYALMHTLTNDSHIILRGEYLQQYFPKTMAYIANFIQ